ncbi:MAG: protein FxsA [Alphaproteobacteria bacterium]|nr:protein FxsA [Alphaproteobacteria bacterium]
MSLVKWTFIGLLLLPVAEMAVFLLVAAMIGWLWAVALFVATSGAGILLLRQTGRAELERFRAAVTQDGARAIDLETPGLARIVGGILLVFPGFITDLVGALLFVPPVRRWAGATIGRALKARRRRRGRHEASVIDLAPDQWHQVPDQAIEDGRPHEQLPPRGRKRSL